MTDTDLLALIALTRAYARHHATSPVVGAAAKKMEQVATNVLRRRHSLAEDMTRAT